MPFHRDSLQAADSEEYDKKKDSKRFKLIKMNALKKSPKSI
jgi:hypothetical protein